MAVRVGTERPRVAEDAADHHSTEPRSKLGLVAQLCDASPGMHEDLLCKVLSLAAATDRLGKTRQLAQQTRVLAIERRLGDRHARDAFHCLSEAIRWRY